ncbi:pyridoxal phosphate-dependent aminotransferase [Mediterranea massiliensis]|nr:MULTISPECIES: pyridoxal phosphate-dependent aminotransferase [Mediterranea]MCL1606547.1 pyridoxal phosphate-dependent aminotransferase [Mediterranea sp. ET5]MDM8121867.1 pyridoxal phosphate-dependent aminotransferase [Mediterranea massiliensis]MDM8197048.1 pyridoxal phosphate-dependent aminotransferase [Mediterranea massiliensis]
MRISKVGDATIRQTVALSEELERRTGEKFIHLEMGSPGLPASRLGIEAQKEALDNGVASSYPNISGIAPLKEQASRFVKAFLDIDVKPEGCIPTVGSMMGTFASFIVCTHLSPEKDTILFINPGFSVQPLQAKVLGYKREAFDVYDCRGERLRDKLESILAKGHIAGIVYSNPNNPSWVCLTEEELRYVGELATKYDAIVIEDLAYLGMDFRKELGHPFEPPYQATVARYTKNYMLMLSASKIFSYAGERIATVAISDELYNRVYPKLKEEFGIDTLGRFFVFVVVYTLSSGVTHSVQYALAAMYKAACDGTLDFVGETREYARRAARLKEIFLRHGFHIVYDKDLDEPVSDGFFFTIGRKGYTGDELLDRLLYYGVSAISLRTTGSEQQGIRVCTSMVKEAHYALLDERLEIFNRMEK